MASSSGRPARDECPTCGRSMQYRRKSEPAPNGHHASVFYCSACDKEVLRG